MSIQEKAFAIIQSAETQLRKLLADSAGASSYDELAFLVRLCSELEGLSKHPPIIDEKHVDNGTALKPAELKAAAGIAPVTTVGGPARRSRPKPEYPWFYRDGDALVKVGWSKSNKSEYEHRSPSPAIEATIEAVQGATTSSEQLFAMEEVLPNVRLPDGTEPPSYQPYLVMAWLRSCGLISTHGRSGYTVDNRDTFRDRAHEQFARLEKR